MPAQIIQPRTAAAASLDGIWKAYATKSKEDIAAEFCSDWTTTTAEDWTGTYIDIFSPDYKSAERLPWDMNKDSRRHIDLRGGELQMSAHFGDGTGWGRRFDPATSANPIFTATSQPHTRQVSFLPTVPPGADVYADAVNGALVFNVTRGKAFGCSCLKWSSVYQGAGGKFGQQVVPPSEADNFLVRVTDTPDDVHKLYQEIPEHYKKVSSTIGWCYGAGFAQSAHGTMKESTIAPIGN